MRIEIRFKVATLPRRYHFLFTSVVKAALETSAPEYQDEMYSYGAKSNKKMKPFTGSIYLDRYKLIKDVFHINGEARLIVSSSDSEFLIYLYNGFVQKSEYKYRDYELHVQNIRMLPERLPTKQRAFYKTLSPIALRGKDGRFLSLENTHYEQELNYICNEIMRALTGVALKMPLTFQPVLMKKRVVQLQHDSFKKLNNQSVLYVNCYEGTFVLSGDLRDLKVLTASGIGHRRSQFFGNVELIDE